MVYPTVPKQRKLVYQDKTPLILLDRRSDKQLYLQIVDGLANLIREGKLKRGQKLPSTRELAEHLQVHRKTLQTALDELSAQGWLEVVPREGTYVTKVFPESKLLKFLCQPVAFPNQANFYFYKTAIKFPPSNYQVSDKLILAEGFPDIRVAPIQELLRELRAVSKRSALKKYFRYGNPQGTDYLRETLASFISETRNIMTTPEQMLITRGAQMAIFLCARTILNPGDNVIVGDPGFVTATLTFQHCGGVINKVQVDQHGIDVDEIEELCKNKKIKLVYVISHHHHPTTVSLSLERRAKLLNLANKYKFAIVEDDYDYDFHYSGNPKAPIASFDQLGNVVYIGTLSKTLIPTLRTGFLIGPQDFISEALKTRRFMDFQGDSFLEVAIAELYRTGLIARLIKKVTKTYKERRDHFCELLQEHLPEDISFTMPEGGLAVWSKFETADLVNVCGLAAKKGLLFGDGRIFNTRHSFNATRLGYSSLNFEEQIRAVEILKDAVIYSRGPINQHP